MTMSVYVYNADIYCEACGSKIREELLKGIPVKAGLIPYTLEDNGDSNDFPQSMPDAGESDSPQHCGECGEFLENDLTSDGVEYLHYAIAEYLHTGHGGCVPQWVDFYDVSLSDLVGWRQGKGK